MSNESNGRQDNKARAFLSELTVADSRSLRASVARVALDTSHSEIELFFRDLLMHGCVSGMVSELTYYHDTHAFFDHYYAEIEELREEYEQEFGQPLAIDGDLKNWFAWFAFEETARQIVAELEMLT